MNWELSIHVKSDEDLINFVAETKLVKLAKQRKKIVFRINILSGNRLYIPGLLLFVHESR